MSLHKKLDTMFVLIAAIRCGTDKFMVNLCSLKYHLEGRSSANFKIQNNNFEFIAASLVQISRYTELADI